MSGGNEAARLVSIRQEFAAYGNSNQSGETMESKTKKKLGTAVGGVAAVGAAVTLTAGTFSYFSDTDTSGDQHLSTGTIELGGSKVQSIKANDWAPGETHTQQYKLTNNGSLKGHLTVGLKDNGGSDALKRALRVKVNSSGWHHLAYVEGKKDYYDLGTLGSGGSKVVSIKVNLPNKNHSQNRLQDKTIHAELVSHLREPGK